MTVMIKSYFYRGRHRAARPARVRVIYRLATLTWLLG